MTVYADPRFWRLALLSATCIGTSWALQGLWAATWLSDVEGLDRPELLRHLLVMAIALSLGALLWGVAVDRLRRHGVGPRALLGLVAMIFIAAQLALILRLPLPSYVPWIVVAAVGAGTVLSYAILAEYFPTDLAGRANAALNLFHIGGAFVVQYMTGLVVQLWASTDGTILRLLIRLRLLSTSAFKSQLGSGVPELGSRHACEECAAVSGMQHVAETQARFRPTGAGRRLRRHVYRKGPALT